MGDPFSSTIFHRQAFLEGPLAQLYLDPSLRLLEVNHRFRGLANSTEDFKGKLLPDLFPALAARTEPVLRQAIAAGQPHTDFHFEGYLSDAGERSLRNWNLVLHLLRNEEGVVSWILATLIDTTSAVKSDSQSRELLSLFHCFVEDSRDAIFLKDREGIYRYMNPAGARMVGRTPAEVVGKTDFDIFRPKDAVKMVATDAVVRESAEGVDLYQDEDFVNGQRTIFLTRKAAIRSLQGEFLGVSGVSRDITAEALQSEERQRLIESLEQSRRDLELERESRERLVADLGHDLRSPLSVAKMASDLLTSGPVSEPLAQELQATLRPALQRMDHMIRDLLDSSKIRAGHPVLVRRKICDLRETFERCLKEMHLIYPGRIQASLKLPPMVGLWDPLAVQRVLENLVHNAIRHGDRSKAVTVELRFENGHQTQISVHNEGDPIPPETLRLLFERFRQGPTPAASPVPSGWGLGLSIVSTLVSAMDGRVEVESGSSSGTLFRISLPVLRLV